MPFSVFHSLDTKCAKTKDDHQPLRAVVKYLKVIAHHPTTREISMILCNEIAESMREYHENKIPYLTSVNLRAAYEMDKVIRVSTP